MEGIISKETCSVRRFFGLLDNIQTKLERLAEDNRPLFNGERFLSDKELSDLLKISRRCLQDYRDQGRISYIRLGGKILYKVSDIEKLLEDNYHEALILSGVQYSRMPAGTIKHRFRLAFLYSDISVRGTVLPFCLLFISRSMSPDILWSVTYA